MKKVSAVICGGACAVWCLGTCTLLILGAVYALF